MHTSVNILGTLTVALCALLLLRAYVRGRAPLLLWSGLCFVGLTLSNALLLVDLVFGPSANLYLGRLGVAGISVLLLVYGLVFESD